MIRQAGLLVTRTGDDVAVRFRRVRLWWMRQHDRSRLWPFCWDCRLAQEAWCRGEFYTHDEPRWYFDECMASAEPARIVAPPVGSNLTIQLDGITIPTPSTHAARANVWIVR